MKNFGFALSSILIFADTPLKVPKVSPKTVAYSATSPSTNVIALTSITLLTSIPRPFIEPRPIRDGQRPGTTYNTSRHSWFPSRTVAGRLPCTGASSPVYPFSMTLDGSRRHDGNVRRKVSSDNTSTRYELPS
ncbi:hypothetical protein MTO96_042633 [Rhipicephalus appendiculatus]